MRFAVRDAGAGIAWIGDLETTDGELVLWLDWADQADRMLRGEVTNRLPSRVGDWDERAVPEGWRGAVRVVGETVFVASLDLEAVEAAAAGTAPEPAADGVVAVGDGEIVWTAVPVAAWEAAWDEARAWARALPPRVSWDVDVEVFSTDLSLALAWEKVDSFTWRVDRELDVLAGTSDERDGGLRAWLTVRVFCDRADQAERAVGELLDRALAARPAHRELPRTIRVAPTTDVDPRPRADDPASYEDRIQPIAWSTWAPTEDPCEIDVRWWSGFQPLSHVTVEETETAVSVVVHHVQPPLYDRDGSDVAIALVGKRHHTSVRLQAPLDDRTVIDGLTGSARESHAA